MSSDLPENKMAVLLAAQPGEGEKLNLADIPFDDFYSFLAENKDSKVTQLVCKVLHEKFRTAFADPDYSDLNPIEEYKKGSALNSSRFKANTDLSQYIYQYNRGTLGLESDPDTKNAEVHAQKRQQGLAGIYDSLRPFFTNHMKTAVVSTAKLDT